MTIFLRAGFVRAHKHETPAVFSRFRGIFVCGLFGLGKPFFAVGDYEIIEAFRLVETAYFELIFYGFLGIILLHNS